MSPSAAAQHAQGKLTARERLAVLFDEGSVAIVHDGDGVVTAAGTINGRRMTSFAQDFADGGGVLTGPHARAICALIDRATATDTPIIGLYDSRGMRADAQDEQAAIIERSARATGIVPQLAVVMGPCVGAAAFLPVIADMVFMVDQTSHLLVAGPAIVKAASNEIVTLEALGGAAVQAATNGIVDAMFDDDIAALFAARDLIDFLPLDNRSGSPRRSTDDPYDRIEDSLDTLIPSLATEPYDMREAIGKIVDEEEFLELKPAHAANIVIGLARIEGRTVGIVANQPMVLGGALDGDALRKATRFVRLCDAFGLPIVTLVDVPGFLPAIGRAHGDIIVEGAALLAANARATVPRVCVVTRRACGGAHAMMAPGQFGGTLSFAWPTADIAAEAVIAPRSTRRRIAEALRTLRDRNEISRTP